ncbi:hypothetical protein CEXT_140941 [Caerostris extrusa]|uniref:Uncharacterized protein n=1 Tax=Caerostris extrusa TaxID=172846 RepID=A0AAV4QMF2_CAEEX|nr:hypothetical protein CEXT_140941 [Caerostris extrusa]
MEESSLQKVSACVQKRHVQVDPRRRCGCQQKASPFILSRKESREMFAPVLYVPCLQTHSLLGASTEVVLLMRLQK